MAVDSTASVRSPYVSAGTFGAVGSVFGFSSFPQPVSSIVNISTDTSSNARYLFKGIPPKETKTSEIANQNRAGCIQSQKIIAYIIYNVKGESMSNYTKMTEERWKIAKKF